MKRLYIFLSLQFLLLCSLCAATPLKARKLSLWHIPAGNYSGITPLREGQYAVVSDKQERDGFFVWQISQDAVTGQVTEVHNLGFQSHDYDFFNHKFSTSRDAEDIVYCSARQSVFISGEGSKDIVEMTLQGSLTGYELPVPNIFRDILPNYGLESLAFDTMSQTFYSTTEQGLSSDSPILLRIQSYQSVCQSDTTTFQVSHQYLYQLDGPSVSATKLSAARQYIHGVVAMTALGEGRIAVLEREAFIKQGYLGSWCRQNLYVVDTHVSPGTMLTKQLITSWTTHFNAFSYRWANYEGMCLGSTLQDGRQTLLLISDSQGGYGRGPIHLHDYIMTIVL